ncbi:unnamed protein product [Parascedosporium putredinis]|uniref:Uncharacterized protein n=1 Tax=Parascedosporium putredinis TaxID=1442378 RepID=A0A9P1HCR9_9PEZI|nr:unnamed protein product [Parascedosporium putredinis]CAI8004986.1 unnamed protein product [Parascedosporium putredinis]
MSLNATPADEDPLVLRPLIADIIRTRYCVPDSLFLVEGVDNLRPRRSRKWRAIRLLLGDGELCIQALLTVDVHRFVNSGEVVAKSKPARKMVYLTVEDFTVVGWHEEYARVHGKSKPSKSRTDVGPSAEKREESLLDKIDSPPRTPARVSERPRTPEPHRKPPPDAPVAEAVEDLEKYFDTSSDDGFEDLPIPDTPPPPEVAPQKAAPIPKDPIPLARNWTNPLTPLKLTQLSAIPHLPYKQNWSTNIIAVRVHLTVFLDAEAFRPRVGSAVLLAGVKNHLFDGGSLKKYVSDRPREGMPWWVEDPTYPWCRDLAEGLKDWWRLASLVEEDDLEEP